MNVRKGIRKGIDGRVCTGADDLPQLGEEPHLGQALAQRIPDSSLQRRGLFDIERIAFLPLEVLFPIDYQSSIGF